MPTYAIGDIHGCFLTLQRLLRQLPFDRQVDSLWLVGDLVNRGPRSLEVLSWAHRQAVELGSRFRMVLGNHELRLLSLDAGVVRPTARDSLEPILSSNKRCELLGWLRAQPFLQLEGSHLMVHAGLLPDWTPARARNLARLASEALISKALPTGSAPSGSTTPNDIDSNLRSLERAIAAFTMLRTVDSRGKPVAFAGSEAEIPDGHRPWFRAISTFDSYILICGHWAALGLKLEQRLLALDSGCVWGGRLSAVRLEDRRLFQEPVMANEALPR